jgi:hypothetical protein
MSAIRNSKNCIYCGKGFQEIDGVNTILGAVATSCFATGNVPGGLLTLGAGAVLGAFKANSNTSTIGTCQKCSKRFR